MPEVSGLTFCIGAPTSHNSIGTSFSKPENEGKESFSTRLKLVDISYLDTYGLELVAGRWMTESEQNSATTGENESRSYVFIVNERLVSTLGLSSAGEAIGFSFQIFSE